jgi:hypothetical protein
MYEIRGRLWLALIIFFRTVMFPKIILNDLRQFPIKVISTEEQKPFIKLVDKLIEAKKQNSLAETTDLENQIDQLVY